MEEGGHTLRLDEAVNKAVNIGAVATKDSTASRVFQNREHCCIFAAARRDEERLSAGSTAAAAVGLSSGPKKGDLDCSSTDVTRAYASGDPRRRLLRMSS